MSEDVIYHFRGLFFMAISGAFNFFITLLIILVAMFVFSHFFGQPIRDAVEKGELTKAELRTTMLSLPHGWIGLGLGFLVMIVRIVYS